MKSKQYKLRTPRLGLPVPGYKAHIWPEIEMMRWQIVENLLLAGPRGQNLTDLIQALQVQQMP